MLNKHTVIMVRFLFLHAVRFDFVLLDLFSDFICSVVGSPLSSLGSQLLLAWITMGAEMMPLSEYTLFLPHIRKWLHASITDL